MSDVSPIAIIIHRRSFTGKRCSPTLGNITVTWVQNIYVFIFLNYYLLFVRDYIWAYLSIAFWWYMWFDFLLYDRLRFEAFLSLFIYFKEQVETHLLTLVWGNFVKLMKIKLFFNFFVRLCWRKYYLVESNK